VNALVHCNCLNAGGRGSPPSTQGGHREDRSLQTVLVPAILAALFACSTPNTAPIATSQQPKITVLYDAFGKVDTLQKDWGYAALVEVGGQRILFDTGDNVR
jgi:hypothetical protein